jgi:hypothetical protein
MSNETLSATKLHLRTQLAEYHKFLMTLCELCLAALALAWLLGFATISHLCISDLQKPIAVKDETTLPAAKQQQQTPNLFTLNGRK